MADPKKVHDSGDGGSSDADEQPDDAGATGTMGEEQRDKPDDR